MDWRLISSGLLLLMLAAIPPGARGSTTPAAAGVTSVACMPQDAADVVNWADPYAAETDGCACVDMADNSTCSCLVGYGGDGTFCYSNCTGTDCEVGWDNSTACTVETGCQCGLNSIRDAASNDACITIPIYQCNPMADFGDERTCICQDLIDQPETAYLDFSTCYCKGGFTPNPNDTRVCTAQCTAGQPNCMEEAGSSLPCTYTSELCRCAPGYAPRITTDQLNVTCEPVTCIQGYGSSVQQSFCLQDLSQHLYDPFFTTCAINTGPKDGQSYCTRDCMVGDPNCLNSRADAECGPDDGNCRCRPGFGLIVNATDPRVSYCIEVWCVPEDPNCLCGDAYNNITDCRCSYWTAPDFDNRGWCTAECPKNSENCVRGDTKERCYDNYVGSEGCHCRHIEGSLFAPFGWQNETSPENITSDMIYCTEEISDNCMIGSSDFCNCTDPMDQNTCHCIIEEGYVLSETEIGMCVEAYCTVIGQLPEKDNNYTCKSYGCFPHAEGAGTNDHCLWGGPLAAGATTASPGSNICTIEMGGNNTVCECDYGYYPDAEGVCVQLDAGRCDARSVAGCSCPTEGTDQLIGCSCALGYYVDTGILNSDFTCINFCSPDSDTADPDPHCHKIGFPDNACEITGEPNFGSCQCGINYRPQLVGSSYICVELNCDWEYASNCEEGPWIDSMTYTNVHCAEGFVPDPYTTPPGECIGGCTDTTEGGHCMEAGTVTNPGSTTCQSPPCFCERGYNPVFVIGTDQIICQEAECNPLLNSLNGHECQCQYTEGAVSYDLAGCRCSRGHAPVFPGDGMCNAFCDLDQDYCKEEEGSRERCTGSDVDCVCRPGFTPIYDESTNLYACTPYECDEGTLGCECSHPGDVTSCTCSGTIELGGVTISFVGDAAAFPGYCRPVECDPGSDPNCECLSSTLAETCYCKSGFSIDLQYANLWADQAAGLDVSGYFTGLCLPIEQRSSCPQDVVGTADPDTGCSCVWTDVQDETLLCKCGIVVDDDCYNIACHTFLDDFAVEADGLCTLREEVVDTKTYRFSTCRAGTVSDHAGGCVPECEWHVNHPAVCNEVGERCAAGYTGKTDFFGHRSCYPVECSPDSENCVCSAAVDLLRGYDDRTCRCGPGLAPDGAGLCSAACTDGEPNCDPDTLLCQPGYTVQAVWARSDGGSITGYAITHTCVEAACNCGESNDCECPEGAYDESLAAGQIGCAAGTIHTGNGDCVDPPVNTCISCSASGLNNDCYKLDIAPSNVDTATLTVSQSSGFSVQTCDKDSGYNTCVMTSVRTGDVWSVSRGCSATPCVENFGNRTLCTNQDTGTRTCVQCCDSSDNCNVLGKNRGAQVRPLPAAALLAAALLAALRHFT